uniref:WD repeat-containing protein n=1 Tax=Coccidioides posadasii RMSCC 3488 TaxID=454284 RepID=A0A0J6FNZ8_COCPO|nr:WD repeat-containing protein [Coccidioides posadasii RMSCC 3488]
MANNNSLGVRSKLSAPAASVKIIPANSPVLKPGTKQPSKLSPYQCTLSLRTVIGTTTSNPNGFSCHESSRTFALCAGSAAVLAELDEDLNISQRFFRARPTATGINSTPSYYNNTSTPPTTPDTRSRTLQAALRPAGNGIPSASSPSEWGEAATPRSWTSRERIKAVTSVALSPNGRFLAVGETGYNPRVLIFSTANDSPSDIPLSILAEHTFGVRSLAFSPDSQYLATLGDINDGFLFIWAINLKSGAARLHSANKCTSFIRDMCWLGTNLITVGVRHIKVWRLGDGTPNSPTRSKANSDPANASPVNPGPIALPGRNCILGSLRDSIFTCISNISDTEAIVCTESGAVCFLDDVGGQQKLHLIKNFDVAILSAAIDHESATVWFGCRDGTFQQALIGDLRHSVSTGVALNTECPRSPKSKHLSTVAMGIVSSYMVMVDSTHAIRVCSLVSPSQCQEDTTQEVDIPAHKDPVLGISAVTAPDIHSSSQFFTWSSNGAVNFWDLEGKCLSTQRVEIEQVLGSSDEPNELKVLRASEDMKIFVSGDKYGVMRRISRESWACEQQVRAHAGEVTDIAIHSSSGLFLTATCGRDRMVQVFQNDGDSFSLIQTMDEHVAAVSRLLFTNDGEKLLSCSADRTVVIRDRMCREIDGTITVAFFLSKVITLKASPISMTLLPDDSDTLVVSTIDRQIHRYDIPSSRHLHSFKSNDSETSDTVVMSSLIVGSEVAGISPKLIIGVSTTDKSVRVYDFGKDGLLTREFGHTEGVSDVLLIETNCGGIQKRTLVSTGLDGIIMIWDLAIQQQQTPLSENAQIPARAEEETPNKESTAVKPPLRRILSRSELAVFQKLDSPSPSPTPIRDPSPPPSRRKTSRYTLYHFARNGTSSSSPQTPPVSLSRRSPTFYLDGNGRNRRDGSVSPPSPKSGSSRTLGTRSSHAKLRRPSIDIRRPKSNGNTSEFGSLNMSTEQVCRTLRAYRKKLHGSTDHLHSATELERELELTVRALTERNKRNQTSEDSTDSDNSKLMPPLPSKPVRLARRVPSTPNLGRSRKSDKNSKQIHRTNSLDADGEG